MLSTTFKNILIITKTKQSTRLDIDFNPCLAETEFNPNIENMTSK